MRACLQNRALHISYSVSFFSRDLSGFSSQNQVVSLGTKSDRHLSSKQDKSEEIAVLKNSPTRHQSSCLGWDERLSATHLVSALEQELVRVHTVGSGTTKPRNVMEDQRREGRVTRKSLEVERTWSSIQRSGCFLPDPQVRYSRPA